MFSDKLRNYLLSEELAPKIVLASSFDNLMRGEKTGAWLIVGLVDEAMSALEGPACLLRYSSLFSGISARKSVSSVSF